MYIAGSERCQISVAEPAPLVVALYLRERAGLDPNLDYELPGLDPPITRWPVWARSAPVGWAPPAAVRDTPVDPGVAAAEWARWWNHLLVEGATSSETFHPPGFRDLRAIPAIQLLLQRHYEEASRWVDAITDDPRVRREQTTPRPGLTAMLAELEADPAARPTPFRLRLTIVPVRTKHAWPLEPDHILISRRLVADTDNVLDWLRPRGVRALARGTATLRPSPDR